MGDPVVNQEAREAQVKNPVKAESGKVGGAYNHKPVSGADSVVKQLRSSGAKEKK